MKNNNAVAIQNKENWACIEHCPPPYFARIFSVWFRHMRVYAGYLVSNAIPPFLEPLIFLGGIGLGLGKYLMPMESLSYLQFLSSGLLMMTAMYTSAFECSYGTYVRLEFDKAYDGMLASPLTADDVLIGEILWAGTKGMFFSLAVLIILFAFQIVPFAVSSLPILATPLIGFCTGIMFAVLSLLVTSFVKNLNHFNFYFTGFLSPMFFLSGIVFPIGDLPEGLRQVAYVFPLTHTVLLTRTFFNGQYHWTQLLSVLYIVVFTAVIGYIAIRRLKKKLVN